MLYKNKNLMIPNAPEASGEVQEDEGAIVARFAAMVNALGPLSQASPALHVHLLERSRPSRSTSMGALRLV